MRPTHILLGGADDSVHAACVNTLCVNAITYTTYTNGINVMSCTTDVLTSY